jgi:hypothetical protein
VLYDLHGFVHGPVEGLGHELRVYFGGRYAGITAGVFLPNGRFELGADFLRHSGFVLGGSDAQRGFAYLLPTLEPRVIFAGDSERTTLVVGSALAGLRYFRLPFAVDVRLPRVDIWGAPFTERRNAALSFGGSIAASYVF